MSGIEFERSIIEREPLRTPDQGRSIFPQSRRDLGDFLNSDSAAGFHSGPQRGARSYKLILICWGATLVDLLINAGLTMLFVGLASLSLHAGMKALLHLFFAGSLAMMLGCVFIVSVGLYKVLLRSALGFTIGDWAWGLRLGDEKAQKKSDYVPRVCLRFFAGLVTGVFLLPVLSLLTGKDWAGRISGLYLHQY